MNRLASGQPGARRFYFVRVLEVESVQHWHGCDVRVLYSSLLQNDSCFTAARAWQRRITSSAAPTVHDRHGNGPPRLSARPLCPWFSESDALSGMVYSLAAYSDPSRPWVGAAIVTRGLRDVTMPGLKRCG